MRAAAGKHQADSCTCRNTAAVKGVFWIWTSSFSWLVCLVTSWTGPPRHSYARLKLGFESCKVLSCVQEQSSNDEYLFDLDHFVQLANEPSDELDRTKLPPLPPTQPSGSDSQPHLVIDARTEGVCFSTFSCAPPHSMSTMF